MNRLYSLFSDLPSSHSAQTQKWISTSQTVTNTMSSPDDIVICAAVRTPMTKAKRGGLKNTPTEEMLVPLFQHIVKTTGVKPTDIQDICIGNVLQASDALCARLGQVLSGLPPTIPIYTVNRQCSSGLQAVANICASIKSGYIDVGIGGGVESMSSYAMEDSLNPENISTSVFDNELAKNCLLPMGMVSEIFTDTMKMQRKELDEIAVDSNLKAAKAAKMGYFKPEIVPVYTQVTDKEGNTKKICITEDDGIRGNSTLQSMSKLASPFKQGGSSHAGNSSQMTDGAAVVLLAKRSKAEQLSLPILAKFHSYATVGTPPEMMPMGPSLAIPKALQMANMNLDDIDIFEVNEAFASVLKYTIDALNLPPHKVNPKGGAIALGHPLGCTGARQVSTLLTELQRTNKRFGIVSMCMGTGMGAAAVIENLI